MLFSLIICFILTSNCKGEMGTNNNNTTNVRLKNLRTSLDRISSLLENIQLKVKNSLNIMDQLTVPTSEPPDFIENYKITDNITQSPDKFTSPTVHWYISSTSKKKEVPWNKLTNYYLTTVKLPTHPFYTFTLTTEPAPTTEPTDFWERFFSAGMGNSKDLWLDSAEIKATPEIEERARTFKTVTISDSTTQRSQCTRKSSTRKHLQDSSQFNIAESTLTKPPALKRYTDFNYKRGFDLHMIDPREHKIQWSLKENTRQAVPIS